MEQTPATICEYPMAGHGMPNVCVVAFIAMIVLLVVIVTLVRLVIWWKICSKAGYSGWLALLILVPFVNIILPLAVAFMDWPVLKELRALKQAGTTGPQ
jgi:hypothetical protein